MCLKEKRKVTLISLLIIIFASIGSAVALFVQRHKPTLPVAEMVNATPEGKTDPVEDPVISNVMEESNAPEVIEEKQKLKV